jgi:hypothetical protein
MASLLKTVMSFLFLSKCLTENTPSNPSHHGLL